MSSKAVSLFDRSILSKAVADSFRKLDPRQMVAAELLVHQRQLQLTIALAAQFRPQVTGPQTLSLDLVLERLDEPGATLGAPHRHAQMRDRFDLVGHEFLDPVELLLEFWIGFEIPSHEVLRDVVSRLAAASVAAIIRELAGSRKKSKRPFEPFLAGPLVIAGRDGDVRRS